MLHIKMTSKWICKNKKGELCTQVLFKDTDQVYRLQKDVGDHLSEWNLDVPTTLRCAVIVGLMKEGDSVQKLLSSQSWAPSPYSCFIGSFQLDVDLLHVLHLLSCFLMFYICRVMFEFSCLLKMSGARIVYFYFRVFLHMFYICFC